MKILFAYQCCMVNCLWLAHHKCKFTDSFRAHLINRRSRITTTIMLATRLAMALASVALVSGQFIPCNNCEPATCAVPDCACSVSQPENVALNDRPQVGEMSSDNGIWTFGHHSRQPLLMLLQFESSLLVPHESLQLSYVSYVCRLSHWAQDEQLDLGTVWPAFFFLGMPKSKMCSLI